MPYRPRSGGRCAKGLTEAVPAQPPFGADDKSDHREIHAPHGRNRNGEQEVLVFMLIFLDRSLRNDS
ncbi:hypothetical protein D3C86_857230 [compost metagenome]